MTASIYGPSSSASQIDQLVVDAFVFSFSSFSLPVSRYVATVTDPHFIWQPTRDRVTSIRSNIRTHSGHIFRYALLRNCRTQGTRPP